MTFAIILTKCYFRIVIKNLTKCNILSTFALKKCGKSTNHYLEKLCSRSLASTISVLDLERVCLRKVGPWPRILYESLALASNVLSPTPPLLVVLIIDCVNIERYLYLLNNFPSFFIILVKIKV